MKFAEFSRLLGRHKPGESHIWTDGLDCADGKEAENGTGCNQNENLVSLANRYDDTENAEREGMMNGEDCTNCVDHV